jgi:hypothetical protein
VGTVCESVRIRRCIGPTDYFSDALVRSGSRHPILADCLVDILEWFWFSGTSHVYDSSVREYSSLVE